MSKIDETINKYLVEGKKEDFEKWVKVVKSCKTEEQLLSATNMGRALYVKYKNAFIEQLEGFLQMDDKLLDDMTDVIKNKRDKLNHESKNKIINSDLLIHGQLGS